MVNARTVFAGVDVGVVCCKHDFLSVLAIYIYNVHDANGHLHVGDGCSGQTVERTGYPATCHIPRPGHAIRESLRISPKQDFFKA